MRPRVFPAEDSTTGTARPAPSSRFNEAAGIPRGRRMFAPVELADFAAASMRPRVFPAEDPGGFGWRCRGRLASMRPRVFPAEDAASRRWPAAHPGRFNEAAGIPRGRRLLRDQERAHLAASMRPRVFPAEDIRNLEPLPLVVRASMRPRVFPAEDLVERAVAQRCRQLQ